MLRSIKDIGELIAARRQRRNMTQAALARQVGVRQATISDIENGNADPRVGTLFAILNALDIGLMTDEHMMRTHQDIGLSNVISSRPYVDIDEHLDRLRKRK